MPILSSLLEEPLFQKGAPPSDRGAPPSLWMSTHHHRGAHPFYLLYLPIYFIHVKCCKPKEPKLEELNAKSSTLKLLLRNYSQDEVRFEKGTMLMQAFILPTIHPTLTHRSKTATNSSGKGRRMDDLLIKKAVKSNVSSLLKKDETEPENRDELDSSSISSSHGSLGQSDPIHKIELLCLPTSYMHMMMDDKFPSCLQVAEINSAIALPYEDECRLSIIADVAMSQQEELWDSNMLPIPHPNPDQESLVRIYPEDLVSQTVQLHSTVSAQKIGSLMDDNSSQAAKDAAYNSICEKLAVVSVDLIKNGSISRCMLAQLQQGDDYLGPLRDQVAKRDKSLPKFFIKDMILYKKYMPKHSVSEKHVICLPDVLLASTGNERS